ncbi:MAG: dihydroorotase [Myxococcota bacterium]
MSQSLTLIQPDDWHLHLRDGAALHSVVDATARSFARAVVMPNLKPPVRTLAEAVAYRGRILSALSTDLEFDPLMTLYLTDSTSAADIYEASESEFVVAAKLYPAGATTNSDAGVTDLARIDGALAAMARTGLRLLVHGEVTHGDVDVFDREAAFLESVLGPLMQRHPELRVVLEHITTSQGVDFVRQFSAERCGGTITPHHLLLNRNALFEGGIRPHRYCLPILKRERHRQALVEAATSGDPHFFLGTDSAPHLRSAKESACGCAGMYTAPNALGLYAEVFEAANALEHLEAFASLNGPRFYGLPANTRRVTLVRQPQEVPQTLELADGVVVPFRAGGTVAWGRAEA